MKEEQKKAVAKILGYTPYDTQLQALYEAFNTTPTADEVCEALSEYYKKEVKYTPLLQRRESAYIKRSAKMGREDTKRNKNGGSKKIVSERGEKMRNYKSKFGDENAN